MARATDLLDLVEGTADEETVLRYLLNRATPRGLSTIDDALAHVQREMEELPLSHEVKRAFIRIPQRDVRRNVAYQYLSRSRDPDLPNPGRNVQERARFVFDRIKDSIPKNADFEDTEDTLRWIRNSNNPLIPDMMDERYALAQMIFDEYQRVHGRRSVTPIEIPDTDQHIFRENVLSLVNSIVSKVLLDGQHVTHTDLLRNSPLTIMSRLSHVRILTREEQRIIAQGLRDIGAYIREVGADLMTDLRGDD